MTDKKKQIAVLTAVVVGISLIVYLSVHYYKRHCATVLIEEANKEIVKLKDTEIQARNALENNRFLMTGSEEVDPLEQGIASAKTEQESIELSLRPIADMFSNGRNDEVRAALAADGSPTRRAIQCQENLRAKVIGYCNGKRASRDASIKNEWFLKARLKKPIDPSLLEKPEELKDIPPEFFALIPKASDQLLKDLATLGAESGGEVDTRLLNSLGVNLLTHRPELVHIQKFGKNDSVKRRAQDMYSRAFAHYLKVRDENDAMSARYRAEKDDGKYSVEAYNKLLSEQAVPVNDVQQGDNLLRALSSYLDELHEQYFIYVSSHRKKSTEFRHTRAKTRLRTRTDSKGHTQTYTETYWETYYTDGYKYYYTLTTVRPGSTTNEEIYVGEIDSTWRSWDYSTEEEVGWVRRWKILHEDNTTIRRGWQKDLNPVMEAERN